eukprot:SAG11_NODE_31397_length_292_cov_0.797927_1_plen_28_part_01
MQQYLTIYCSVLNLVAVLNFLQDPTRSE